MGQMGHGSIVNGSRGSWVKLSDPSSTLVHWRFLFSILQAIIETSQFAYNDGNTKSAACASPCRPEVTSQTNFSTQIYILLMMIRGHFMLSVRLLPKWSSYWRLKMGQQIKMVELVCLNLVSPSLFLAVGIDDAVELFILKSE